MNWFIERHTFKDKTLRLLVAKAFEYFQDITNNQAYQYHSICSILGILYKVKSNETRRNILLIIA